MISFWNRKTVIPALLLCLLVGLFNRVAIAQKKPNILVIISDDHTMNSIGAYGSTFGVTPHIDKLASEGMVFNRSFVTNSICAPSRAVLLTGKFSHKNGHINNLSRFNSTQPQFHHYLNEADYLTAWIGKWHLESEPQGFDYWQVLPGQGHYYNPDFIMMDGTRKRFNGYATNIITEEAIQWLDARDTSKPFCLVIGQKATHRTWMPDTVDFGSTDQLNIPLPGNFYDDYQGRIAAQDQDLSIEKTMLLGYDLKMFDHDSLALKDGNIKRMTKSQQQQFFKYYNSIKEELLSQKLTGQALTEWKYQRYMKDYLATTLSLDRSVGTITTWLQANNLQDNTLVIYTSDQGFYLGEHGWFDKRFMYEESMSTPLIIRYPEMIKAGTHNNYLVQNLDLAPTFLQLAGLSVPDDMQGQSILPLLKGDADIKDWRNGVYYHYYEYPGEHQVYRHFGIRTNRYKLIRFYGEKNFWELYDLKNDPAEMKNLYATKAYGKITTDLKNQLQKLITQYDDQEAMAILKKEK